MFFLFLSLGMLSFGCKPRQSQTADLSAVEKQYAHKTLAKDLIESTLDLSVQAYESDLDRLKNDILPKIKLVPEESDKRDHFEFRGISGIFAAPGPMLVVDTADRKPQLINLILIAFRGTANLLNIITDLNITRKIFYRGYVHQGFYDAYFVFFSDAHVYLSGANKTTRFIEKHLVKQTPGRIPMRNYIVFTGHSLGGALGLISAMDNCHPAHRFRQEFDTTCLAYTYAAPRTFDEENKVFFNSFMQYRDGEFELAALSTGKIRTGFTHFNFQYKGDPVPTAGLESYTHSGNIYHISERDDALPALYSFSKHSVAEVYKPAILDYLEKSTTSKYKVQIELPDYLRERLP